MKLSSVRYNLSQLNLADWSLIKVTGNDRETFFQGQVTNDLLALSYGEAQLTARLNRVGKLQSFFFIARTAECLYLLCQRVLCESVINDFNKFIIMDDVELTVIDKPLYLIFNPLLLKEKIPFIFNLNFYGIQAALTFDSTITERADESELEKIRQLNGFPLWDKDVNASMFINDSLLNELAISYKKGCFLGQETVAKIENNRGAAYYPVLIESTSPLNSDLAGKNFDVNERKAGTVSYIVENKLIAQLFRDFRVEGKKLDLHFGQETVTGHIHYLPYFKNQDSLSIALELYHLGVDTFQSGDNDLALKFMQRALAFNPAFADAYESMGVILGRQEKYQEAIQWMDQLLAINSGSVMAHTNKSLYLMKLGKIEEAEAEKALATVKSFAMYGEEAKLKKAQEEERLKKEADINRREKMFLQVLELDAEDSIALYGLADVAFFRGQFNSAIPSLEKLLQLDPKYSTAYLLLGKCYEAVSKADEAIKTYQQGIEQASKQGDMMPANEMQSRLNQLVMSSRLS